MPRTRRRLAKKIPHSAGSNTVNNQALDRVLSRSLHLCEYRPPTGQQQRHPPPPDNHHHDPEANRRPHPSRRRRGTSTRCPSPFPHLLAGGPGSVLLSSWSLNSILPGNLAFSGLFFTFISRHRELIVRHRQADCIELALYSCPAGLGLDDLGHHKLIDFVPASLARSLFATHHGQLVSCSVPWRSLNWITVALANRRQDLALPSARSGIP